ncbi:leucine/isoleucine/valine transporter ATP-binding subunit [Mesotoga sp. Brook.08.YT.4.2.5.1]|uniref:ABC transporter ATP-binding protein n=1 Tax=unclassified Mesotoga TaxID=1184398 RepID=UPI000C9A7196|nr:MULTISPECIES: ABC transporter ATP-binding protein [unclassified Mesotoga]PNE19865.1 leucine/isoleucine/valine transporter ATP-binding subunit [Mesotoga sp. Brook.08.YT.4.2.5.1]RAO96530.1 ABC transporter [Mesotoga sp. Brook.08.YT.4.2.5.4.]RDI93678.1 leucine/isoleucine/valine transporter ATP-binding subunit [Mesotoga sp. Brook.08.YT.4.2.5.2.]HNU23471.1 ABC transporter ATP-binding protein [Mesotoga sp.]
MSLLKLEQVTKRFGGLTAVSDFNLDLQEGELVGLIGPNGAGKTTVFNLITNTYYVSEGRILLDGKDITGMKTDRIAAAGIARTFQNIRLFGELTVLENVLTACHLRLKSSVISAVFGLPGYRSEEVQMHGKARALLKTLGLDKYERDLAGSLPYGLQRKLEIARALATQPRVLLLDEPAAGMNPEETLALAALILRIRKDFQQTILLIEHDMSLVMTICERIIVLDHGVTIAKGLPEEIQNNPDVITAYLGTGDLYA